MDFYPVLPTFWFPISFICGYILNTSSLLIQIFGQIWSQSHQTFGKRFQVCIFKHNQFFSVPCWIGENSNIFKLAVLQSDSMKQNYITITFILVAGTSKNKNCTWNIFSYFRFNTFGLRCCFNEHLSRRIPLKMTIGRLIHNFSKLILSNFMTKHYLLGRLVTLVIKLI